jgi:hypothetical protein
LSVLHGHVDLLLGFTVEAVSNFLKCHHVAFEGFCHQHFGELVQAFAALDGSDNGFTPFCTPRSIVVAFLASDWH